MSYEKFDDYYLCAPDGKYEWLFRVHDPGGVQFDYVEIKCLEILTSKIRIKESDRSYARKQWNWLLGKGYYQKK